MAKKNLNIPKTKSVKPLVQPIATSKKTKPSNELTTMLICFVSLIVAAIILGGLRYFIISLTGVTLAFFYIIDVVALIQGVILGLIAKKFLNQIPLIVLIIFLLLGGVTAYFTDHYLSFNNVNSELNSLYGETISFTEYFKVVFSSDQETTMRRGKSFSMPAYIPELAYLIFLLGFSTYTLLKND